MRFKTSSSQRGLTGKNTIIQKQNHSHRAPQPPKMTVSEFRSRRQTERWILGYEEPAVPTGFPTLCERFVNIKAAGERGVVTAPQTRPHLTDVCRDGQRGSESSFKVEQKELTWTTRRDTTCQRLWQEVQHKHHQTKKMEVFLKTQSRLTLFDCSIVYSVSSELLVKSFLLTELWYKLYNEF